VFALRALAPKVLLQKSKIFEKTGGFLRRLKSEEAITALLNRARLIILLV
jgi:hypothetical protein